MRLKKVFAGALAAAMLVCAVAVPAFAAEEVEQENCLSSSYVQMNIPYTDFYKAAGVDNASEIDAVTSATKNKTRAGNLAAGSYHVNADGTDITGVSFPVKVLTPWALKNAKQVTDAATITPAAKPVRARWMPSRREFFKKNTQPAPRLVPRKGIRIPQNASCIM